MGRKSELISNKLSVLRLFSCKYVHIRVFHITWITFFLCFFAWFGITSLYNPWIINHINITNNYNIITRTFNRGTSLDALSTIIFRIIFGFLCDFMGPRYSYLLLLIVGIISQILLIFISDKIGYILISGLIGVIGGSFVITEYHVTNMFASNVIGLVLGTVAGWGNLGGGITSLLLPIICQYITNNEWRLAILVPIILLAFIAFPLYYFCAPDTPTKLCEVDAPFTRDNFRKTVSKFKTTIMDIRTWICFCCYGACFGIEVLILRYVSQYLVYQFGMDIHKANSIVLIFSSLNIFARSLGGYASDMIHYKFGIKGRVYTLFMCLICSALFMILFSTGYFDIGYTILMLIFLSLYIQFSEGVTMALGVYIGNSDSIGCRFGIIGAGGNFAVLLFSAGMFRFTPNKLSYFMSWHILGIYMFITGILSLFIWFNKHEIKETNKEIKQIKIQNEVNNNINDDMNIEFVLHDEMTSENNIETNNCENDTNNETEIYMATTKQI